MNAIFTHINKKEIEPRVFLKLITNMLVKIITDDEKFVRLVIFLDLKYFLAF